MCVCLCYARMASFTMRVLFSYSSFSTIPVTPVNPCYVSLTLLLYVLTVEFFLFLFALLDSVCVLAEHVSSVLI